MTTADAHPSTHVLADLAEGVLDDARASEVQAHVDQCDSCQGTLDELAQVTAALRALPAKLPVPEFVAARISHALAAERSSGTTGSAGAAVAGGATPEQASGAGTVAWFRRRLPQGLAAAASVAVLGLAGYVAVEGGGGGSDSDSSAGDAAAAGADEAVSGFATPSHDRRIGTQDTTMLDNPTAEAPDAAQEHSTMEGVDAAELTAAAQAVIRQREAVNDTCGQNLADEQGQPLVGSAHDFAGVVVVLDAGTTYEAWLIETCNSVALQQIVGPVDVPKAE